MKFSHKDASNGFVRKEPCFHDQTTSTHIMFSEGNYHKLKGNIYISQNLIKNTFRPGTLVYFDDFLILASHLLLNSFLDIWQYNSRLSNSSFTSSIDAQPRSHLNEDNASFLLPLVNSHTGDSGIYNVKHFQRKYKFKCRSSGNTFLILYS